MKATVVDFQLYWDDAVRALLFPTYVSLTHTFTHTHTHIHMASRLYGQYAC